MRRPTGDGPGKPAVAVTPPDPIALRREVYGCDACAPLALGFSRPRPGAGFYKFPPIIGAQGAAPLLFVGLNPRRSSTNLDLHEHIMADAAAFDDLAHNQVGGLPYVEVDGAERHYRVHARIAAALFPGRRFEEIAAVTELYFCATDSSEGLQKGERRCAERHLGLVFQIVRPRVVIAVGRDAERYLRPRFGAQNGPFRAAPGGVRVLVVPVRHPNAWGDRGSGDDDAIAVAATELGVVLGARSPVVGEQDSIPADLLPAPQANPAPRPWPWLVFTGASVAGLATMICCCGGGS